MRELYNYSPWRESQDPSFSPSGRDPENNLTKLDGPPRIPLHNQTSRLNALSLSVALALKKRRLALGGATADVARRGKLLVKRRRVWCQETIVG